MVFYGPPWGSVCLGFCPHRLVAQDPWFSARRRGFDSPWGYLPAEVFRPADHRTGVRRDLGLGGRLAQLAEHIAHIDGVAGSSPAAAIQIRRSRRIVFYAESHARLGDCLWRRFRSRGTVRSQWMGTISSGGNYGPIAHAASADVALVQLRLDTTFPGGLYHV